MRRADVSRILKGMETRNLDPVASREPPARPRRFAILGSPVDHSLSPTIHSTFFENHDLRATYERIEMTEEQVPRELPRLVDAGFSGFNVTFPLKGVVARFLEDLGTEARRLGAVNTLVVRPSSGDEEAAGVDPQRAAARRFRGENTDGDGFCLYLERELEVDVAASRFLLLGTGKTARSIMLALEARQVADVVMINRSRGRLEDTFMVDLERRQPGWRAHCQEDLGAGDYDRLFEVDWIVHATSLGLSGAAAEFPWPLDRIPESARVCDLNYLEGRPTPLLQVLPAGVRAVDGTGMLAYQAARAFEHWWGFFPVMDGVLERLSPGA